VSGARYGARMNDQETGAPDAPPAGLVAVCASCSALHPDEQRCACIVARAQAVAENVHERRRAERPAWRRPRSWEALPEAVRADLTVAALDVVDLLEGSGWRLVATRGEGRHVALEDMRTPPSGSFRVRDVVQ